MGAGRDATGCDGMRRDATGSQGLEGEALVFGRYMRKQEELCCFGWFWFLIGLRLFCSKSFHCVALKCLVEVFEKAGSSVNQSGFLFKGFFWTSFTSLG